MPKCLSKSFGTKVSPSKFLEINIYCVLGFSSSLPSSGVVVSPPSGFSGNSSTIIVLSSFKSAFVMSLSEPNKAVCEPKYFAVNMLVDAFTDLIENSPK